MPKLPASNSARLKIYVSENEGVFSTDNQILFCKLCDIRVNSQKRFTVNQHLKTAKHLRAVNRLKTNAIKTNQNLVSNAICGKHSVFNEDLCKMMLSANIPLSKLNNKFLSEFLIKYTNKDIPNESTLRKNYVTDIYKKKIGSIKRYVNNKNIWICIDETTDVEGRYVANVIIGTLEIDAPGKTFLFNSEVLDQTNHKTICKLFDETLFLLWPEGIKRDNVLLFVSDAAPYMVKAGKALSALYTKMIHITCLAHAVHRVCEEIRKNFPKIDSLISNGKKIFLKAPSRVLIFKNNAPGIPLPPQPIITRWGTWLEAATYYCDNYKAFCEVINMLNEEDAVSIEHVKKLIQEPTLEGNLIFIKTHFSFIPNKITFLEKQDVLLADSISSFEEIVKKISETPGSIGKLINNKLNTILKKNTAYVLLKNIKDIISGTRESIPNMDQNITVTDIPYFKYAPVSSVDVERSFSTYKTVLADNRRRFTFENLKKTLIIQCNSHFNGKSIEKINFKIK